MAAIIRAHKLAAIFIESSYSNEQADKQLYGHLKPDLLLLELEHLASLVDPKDPQHALKDLVVVLTHTKQGFEQKARPTLILKQLQNKNKLGIRFILPRQGEVIKI